MKSMEEAQSVLIKLLKVLEITPDQLSNGGKIVLTISQMESGGIMCQCDMRQAGPQTDPLDAFEGMRSDPNAKRMAAAAGCTQNLDKSVKGATHGSHTECASCGNQPLCSMLQGLVDEGKTSDERAVIARRDPNTGLITGVWAMHGTPEGWSCPDLDLTGYPDMAAMADAIIAKARALEDAPPPPVNKDTVDLRTMMPASMARN